MKKEANDLIKELTINDIKEKIYTIRNQRVMLDSDLAEIYGYEVKALNQQVKNNINRFPEDFVFQLNKEELPIDCSKSNFLTLNGKSNKRGTNIKKMPYAFTEQGIYMLATVLRGELAEKQSIFLIRAFKQMKDYISENRLLLSPIEENKLLSVNLRLDTHEKMITKQDERMDEISGNITSINNKIDIINQNFIDDKVKQICILNNQKFEASIAYISIIKEAKSSIYLIDNYVDIETLELLTNKNKNVNVVIFTENKGINKLTKLIVNNFNSQYPSLILKPNNLCHDRYFVIDYKTSNQKIYHLGASIKDGGEKISTINEIIDNSLLDTSISQLLKQKDLTLTK